MDRVRFGRALGYGARHAARAFVQAADAATTPSAKTAPGNTSSPPRAANRVAHAVRTAAPVQQKAAKSFLHPVKRYSGTVLLQVVGTFFAVFALLMAQNAYRLRAGLHTSLRFSDAQRFWLMVALTFVFAWFAVSSFLRARRIERS